MVAITLLIGAAAALAHPPVHTPAVPAVRHLNLEKFDVVSCKGGAGCNTDDGARYRLARDSEPTFTSKDRAFAEDGTRCGVMGPSACPGGTHAILRAGEDPLTTIAASFRQ